MSGSPTAIAPVVQRGLWLDSALDEMRRDLEQDRFVSAIGHFREALGLSRGLPQLKARVNEQAEIYSEELLPRNWRVAEAILHEAAATDPALKPDPELLEKVKQARHDEFISSVIYRADRLELEGKETEARERLAQALVAYPQENRLKERVGTVDPPPDAAKPELAVQPEPVATPAVKPVSPASQLQALSVAIAADEQGNTEEVRAEPETEIPLPGFLTESAKAWPTKVLISTSAWNAIKDLTAVVATVAMLGTAGFLIWKHLKEPPTRSPSVRAVLPSSSTADAPVPASTPAGNSIFQDVPVPASDQDAILQAVRAYSETKGQKIGSDVLDDVDIQGKKAKVRYRPKDNPAGTRIVFSLVRQEDGWKVQSVQ